MIKLLLIKVLFLIELTPLSAQKISCPPATDSTWADKRHPLKKYTNRTTFIFESYFKDTVSVIIDGKLVAKRYMETDPSGGAVIGLLTVNQPKVGKVVIRTDRSTCTMFTLKKGYAYAYVSRDVFDKWFVTYSNYQRMNF